MSFAACAAKKEADEEAPRAEAPPAVAEPAPMAEEPDAEALAIAVYEFVPAQSGAAGSADGSTVDADERTAGKRGTPSGGTSDAMKAGKGAEARAGGSTDNGSARGDTDADGGSPIDPATTPAGLKYNEIDEDLMTLRMERDQQTEGARRKARSPVVDDAERVEGDPQQLAIPTETKMRMNNFDIAAITTRAKLCMDAEGKPTGVRIVESSGFEEADSMIVEELKQWRYEPYMVEKKAVPFCEVIAFRMRLDDKTKDL